MSVKTKVLTFLTEGSVPVGTGHLRRCASLAHHLHRRGWNTSFQVLGSHCQNLPGTAISSILNGLEWEAAPLPSSPCLATAAIVDVTPARQKEIVGWCRGQNLACLALDYQEASLLPDAIVTLKDLSGQMRSAYAHAGRAEEYHEGVQYAMIRPSIVAQRAQSESPGHHGTLNVIVTLGGTDPAGLTLEAMALLHSWRSHFTRVTVVLGPGVGHDLELQSRQKAAQFGFHVVKNPHDFDQILGHADLVLCNGGGTLLEALCLGRLVAVLPQTEAESTFASTFCQQQACVWAREMSKLLDLTAQERLEFASRAANIVDGNGLDRITSVIEGLVDSTDQR